MKKGCSMILLIVILFLALLLVLAVTTSKNGSGDVVDGSNEVSSQAPIKAEGNQKKDGEIGHYTVTVNSAKVAKASYGDDYYLIVSYSFTNYAADPISFFAAVNTKAFQNGVEAQNAYSALLVSDDCQDYDNNYKDITKGTTLDVYGVYKLNDRENSVSIEIQTNSIFAVEKLTYDIEISQ